MWQRRQRRVFNLVVSLALLSSLATACVPASNLGLTCPAAAATSVPTATVPSATSTASVVQATPTAGVSTTTASAAPLPGTGAGAIADVAAKARLGVVQITTAQVSLNSLNQETLIPQGVGSGVILDSQGHILTNSHVVADAQTLQVSLPDWRTFPAKLVGQDPRSDLAVIQIQGSDLPAMPLGDSSKLVVG